jgi:uncharacterized membrane protein YciS (DUF1049 family)
MSRVKKVLANIGKYLVFCLLMGLGGMIVSTIISVLFVRSFVHGWAWILGEPKEGSTYAAIVQLISFALWGLIGPILATAVYPMIFKQFPARWMGITSVAVIGFSWILIVLIVVVGVAIGSANEIELDTWEELAHSSAAIATLWCVFSLPPFSRYDYDRQVALYQSEPKLSPRR